MTYKVYDTLKYFEKYDGKRVRITYGNQEFNILFNKYSVPHLLGLHYQYKEYASDNNKYRVDENNNVVMANDIYDKIINYQISDEDIYRKIKTNNPDYL